KKYKATVALTISMVGCLLTYPYHESFWGGLIYSGFLAAMIGGLADWFAITALFRRPLGIAYRTEIIPRNRKRIFNEMIVFVSKDLLNPLNIMKVVQQYDTSEMVIKYLEENDGQTKVKVLVQQLSTALLDNVDSQAIGALIEGVIKDGVKDINLVPALQTSLIWSIEHQYDEAVVNFMLDELIWIIREDEMKKKLTLLIEKAKEEYEGSSKRRQIASMIFAISSERLATMAQKEIIHYLESLHESDHKLRVQLKRSLKDMVVTLATSPAFQELIKNYQAKIISEKLNIGEKVSEYIHTILQPVATQKSLTHPSQIDRFIDEKVVELKKNVRVQTVVDTKIKAYLEIFITEQHDLIMKIMQERLNEFSNEALVNFIENRVGDDLQMIRINGSLIGGVVGMVLYVITFLAERMWC
ncbi:MAG: hypothetical protein H6Q70_4505, partial [Firmicutes bacterium]|nr:hypothetical protein [Bacillota bacterium]